MQNRFLDGDGLAEAPLRLNDKSDDCEVTFKAGYLSEVDTSPYLGNDEVLRTEEHEIGHLLGFCHLAEPADNIMQGDPKDTPPGSCKLPNPNRR